MCDESDVTNLKTPSRNAIGLDNIRLFNQFMIMSNLHKLIYFYCDEIWRAAGFQSYFGKAWSFDRLAKEIVTLVSSNASPGHWIQWMPCNFKDVTAERDITLESKRKSKQL